MTAERRSYPNAIAELAQLETFDANAFRANEKAEKAECDFVLALALAFNDLKDLLFSESLAIQDAPSDRKVSRERGAYAGVHIHHIRFLFGYLYELLNVIQGNEEVRKRPSFETLIKRLPRAARAAWHDLVAVADGDQWSKTSSDDIRLLLLARNRAAFHYDPSAIGSGFRAACFTEGHVPHLSRGDSIASSRFYFADLAAQSFLRELFGCEPEKFFFDRRDLLSNIGIALHTIVATFVVMRGYAWRQV